MRVVTTSEAETIRLGRQIAAQLNGPRVILLEGELGAGKTALTRGIAYGLGVSEENPVASPTFALVNQYPCRLGILHHIDLYRLATLRDLYSIGIEDILAGDSVVVIEWAEKMNLPVEEPLKIRIAAGSSAEERIFDIEPAIDLSILPRLPAN